MYYGRTNIDPGIDVSTDADVTINGWYSTFAGNSLAYEDVNGDNIDDILIGACLDFNGVSAVDVNNVWAAGEQGTIIFYDGIL